MSIYRLRNGLPEVTGAASVIFQNAAREFKTTPEHLLALWMDDWLKREEERLKKKKVRPPKGDSP